MVTSSPFRAAPIDEACDHCRGQAQVRCERCGRPFCERHAPARGRRCTDCEATFEARVDRPLVLLLPLGICVVGLLGAAAAFTALSSTPALVSVVVFGLGALCAAPFFAIGCRGLYYGCARIAFLRQRDRRAQLPLSYSEESWFEVGESWAPRA